MKQGGTHHWKALRVDYFYWHFLFNQKFQPDLNCDIKPLDISLSSWNSLRLKRSSVPVIFNVTNEHFHSFGDLL